MLTAEERQEIEAELEHYPTKQAVCIDASTHEVFQSTSASC